MSTTNFEFNGLMDSILPNIYINRIILERIDSQSLSSNKYDMTPHINTKAKDGKNISGPALYNGVGYKNVLKVTLDMFLEIPDVDDDDFWNMILNEDMMNYLSIKAEFYEGKPGKARYMWKTGQGPVVTNVGPAITFDTSMSIAGKRVSTAGSNKDNPANQLKDAKKRYKDFLPDGTPVFKIPVQTVAHLSNAFPTDLAVIASCTIDPEKLALDMATAGADNLSIVAQIAEGPMRGRLATEVIIQNNKVQDKGMLFFISSDQGERSYGGSAGTSSKTVAITEFDHLKGQLWLGDVHKESYAGRYMVGKKHNYVDPHPYLDYIIVPNNRIQDFRQVAIIQKQLINFTPATELVFGGTYTKNIATKALDNTAMFSNLISSITQDGKVKLFFNVDWGRLIKKHCAVPALMDKLTGTKLNKLVHGTFATSFKIFKEEIGIPHSVVNQDNRELIYDSYPKTFHFKNPLVDKIPTSSLVPIPLYVDEPYAGYVRSYSFTDYRKDPNTKLTKLNHKLGKFKYSVEITIQDPTISFLTGELLTCQLAVRILKEYMQLATGQRRQGLDPHPLAAAHGKPYWNSYLGKFNDDFKEKVPNPVGTAGSTVIKAIKTFHLLIKTFRSDYTLSAAKISTEDKGSDASFWGSSGGSLAALAEAFVPMLSPNSATPDSITTAYELFVTLTSQLKNIIESFSTATFPKESSGTDASGNKILQQFTKTPIGADLPHRKLKVAHTFEDPADIVDTTMAMAGHDIFAHIGNRSENDLGLKLMWVGDYTEESVLELKRFFTPDLVAAGSAKVLFEIDHPKLKEKNIPFDAVFAHGKGRFFTVPEDLNSAEQLPLHTILPDTIMSRDDDEFSYKRLINNIIRYKFNLFGNPDNTSFLGYADPGDVAGLSIITTAIGDKMERVIKAYQSLAHQNAVLNYAAVGLTGKKITAYTGYASDSETEPPPDLPNISNQLPWIKDIKQERFLLALIMQDYFNLSFDDKKLGTFNTNNKLTPLGQYFNNLATTVKGGNFVTETQIINRINQGLRSQAVYGAAGEDQIIPGFRDLPNQVKALIFNNTSGDQPAVDISTQQKLNDSVLYADDNKLNKLYKTKTMLASNFGEFWFKHQNLFEIEYLSGYGKASVPIPIPPPPTVGSYAYDPKTKTWKFMPAPGSVPESLQIKSPQLYENTMNSSIRAPSWKPLNWNFTTTLGDSGRLLLCRFKKYEHPIFNQKAYDILDLPLYDQHFFLYFGPENAAYVNPYKAVIDYNQTMGTLGEEYIKLK